MVENELHYFAGGHTAKGFYSVYDHIIEPLHRLFILIGAPSTGQSPIMESIGKKLLDQGVTVHFLHSASNPDDIDGIIMPTYYIGIINGTIPYAFNIIAPYVKEEYVHTGMAISKEKLALNKELIVTKTAERERLYSKAHDTFAQALHIHKKHEQIYIAKMDFEKADELTNELIQQIGVNEQNVNEEEGTEVRRFLGAATPDGAIDFIPNLTAHCKKRYLIKGRAGTGKSTMLKKIATTAQDNGYNVEIYHCGFDPISIDMVIIPAKKVAIFDSTGPHTYDKQFDTDEIIDMYNDCIKEGTDELYADSIKEKKDAYKDKMKEAIHYLQKAKQLHDEVKAMYKLAVNDSVIDEIKSHLLQEIKTMIAQQAK